MDTKINYKTLESITAGFIQLLIFFVLILPGSSLAGEEDEAVVIEIELGDYSFTPSEIKLNTNQQAVFRLINTDSIVPHNFTLTTSDAATDISVDLAGGESVDIQIPPLPEGSYTFHCDSKLLFLKSHREKGMVGTLVITSE